MRLGDKLKQSEFRELSSEMANDMESVFLVYREHALQTLRQASANNWTTERLENALDANIQLETEDKMDLVRQVEKTLNLKAIEGNRQLKQRLSRLAKKTGWTGGNLNELMSRVTRFNADKISAKAMRDVKDDFDPTLKRLGTKKKKIILPKINEVFPSRVNFVNKAAERGRLLTDEMRDQLSSDLRAAMKEQGIISTRGVSAGQLKSGLVENVEKRFQKTFEKAVKKDPKLGMPKHVHDIAVTETRSAVNQIKKEYTKAAVQRNDLQATKTWIHNPQLSRTKPRLEHRALNGKTIPIDAKFTIRADDGIYHVDAPHDSSLPASQVVSCHCELIYEVQRKKE